MTTQNESPASEAMTADLSEGAQSDADGQNDTEVTSEGKDSGAQPGKRPGSREANTAQKAETLRKLLKREKEDPSVKFNDQELDLLEEHFAGKIEPAKAPSKTAAPSPKPDDAEADPDTKETETEPEEGDEEVFEDEDDAEKEEEGPEFDPDAEALMKEVGAKSLKDALAKFKQLRSKVGGRDAQQVAALERQIQSEKTLWSDVAKGVPAAIEYAQKNYGIKLQVPGGTPDGTRTPEKGTSQAREPRRPSQDGKRSYVNKEEFIDPDSAEMVNRILQDRDREIDELRDKYRSFDEERERTKKEAADASGVALTIDHMVEVAQGIPTLKAIGNLREAIASWYKGGSDARMEAFNELFDITQAEGCSLKAAALIKRGRDSEKLVAEAEVRGRAAAYKHQPNPSLSGSQGGKGEKTTYQNLTTEQLEAMSENHKLMPADWFDEKDAPVQSKIPKRAWKIFGFK